MILTGLVSMYTLFLSNILIWPGMWQEILLQERPCIHVEERIRDTSLIVKELPSFDNEGMMLL